MISPGALPNRSGGNMRVNWWREARRGWLIAAACCALSLLLRKRRWKTAGLTK